MKFPFILVLVFVLTVVVAALKHKKTAKKAARKERMDAMKQCGDWTFSYTACNDNKMNVTKTPSNLEKCQSRTHVLECVEEKKKKYNCVKTIDRTACGDMSQIETSQITITKLECGRMKGRKGPIKKPCKTAGFLKRKTKKKNKGECKYRRTSWEECDSKTNMRVMIKTLRRGDPTQCEPTQSVEKKCKWKKKTNSVHGTLRMPKYYSNHMVLQRAPARAILWGYADVVGDAITILLNGVQIEETTVQKSTTNGTVGFWKVKLPAETNPGPHELQVKSSEGFLSFVDVMYGDVWMCSGQSNMQFTMRQVFNSAHEIDDSIQYSNIRMLFSNLVKSDVPLDDVSLKRQWIYPVKGIINEFSALCFMFARDLQKHLKYPIGVIESDWGGTPIEVWSSSDAITACPTTSSLTPFKRWPNKGVLWNSMIHPYLSMTIKGAIWYQGEANSGHSDLYACQFPAMIDDWRKKFHAASDGETSEHFPFGFVQLAPNRAGNTVGGFPPTRWAQTTDIGYVPNSNMPDTFMAVAIDLPDFSSPSGTIHPTYKQDIAARLVLGAMNVAYGDTSVVFQGPFPSEYDMNNEQHTLKITFDNGAGNLLVNNNNGFEVCCASTTSGCSNPSSWVVAPVKVSETSNVQLDTSGCHGNYHVAGVRYLWKESPCALKQCALYDSNTQLPVPPFIKIEIFQSSSIGIIG